MRHGFATESGGQETGYAAANDSGLSQGPLNSGSGCLLGRTSVWQYLESQEAIVVDYGRLGGHDSQVTASVQQFPFLPVPGPATTQPDNSGQLNRIRSV